MIDSVHPRIIFHVDMDAFFVSVEELSDPSLQGKAVVVGGKSNERGVVAAASYEARKFGVHSAMPLRTAYKLCPQAIFLDGHPERYREYSSKVHSVLQQFSPKVEMASIDEAYVDMSGTERLHGPPFKAAHQIHQTMGSQLRLRCSIGIGRSRLVAKISSDLAKPNGLLWVIPAQEQSFLAPLDVRKIPGVGKVTEIRLRELGINKIGDLASHDESFLEEKLGKWALSLAGKARGLDAGAWFENEVGESGGPKSISHEHTFSEDTNSPAILEGMLARLSEMVGRRLREQSLHAHTLQLKLRLHDFSTIERSHSIEGTTQLDTEIFDLIRRLFRKNWPAGAAVRLVGVQASSLEDEESGGQMSLMEGRERGRWKTLLSTMDGLRDKHGDSTITLANSAKARFRERTHDNPAGLQGKHSTGDDE